MSVSDLREEVLSLYHTWRGCCGVLLFLYSVILTKVNENVVIERIKIEADNVLPGIYTMHFEEIFLSLHSSFPFSSETQMSSYYISLAVFLYFLMYF